MDKTLVTFFIFIEIVLTQNPSPCPEIFSYEPRGREQDRWYGVMSIQTQEDLEGIWLRVVLDRPAELLGNWFGEATSSDNREFIVKNTRYKLEAGPPVSIRFFVKYNAASTIPSIVSIKLNGKTICKERGEEASRPTSPTLHISQIKTTSRPGRPSRPHTSSEDFSSNSDDGGSSNNGGSNQNNGGNRRPSGTRSTSTTSSPTSEEERPNSNGLSVGDNQKPVLNGFDFFPGDHALNRPRPTQGRPFSRPTKRSAQCGTVATKASPLISHGQNTTQGEWPWHVALYHTQQAQFMYTCGATLISETHVLTAAHCVARPQTNRPIDTSNLSIYLGKYSLKKFGAGVQDREVSEIHIHPQYNYSVFFNDIAILKLETPIEISNFVRPCCLWDESSDLDRVLNKLGTVVGWGFDENREISDTLSKAQMPVVTTVQCIYSNRDFFSQFTFEKNFCAGFRNGTTVCNGDSGSGMVFPKAGTSGGNTVWQIRGIVSVGVALQGEGVCDPAHYIVFTDVAKHLQWIQQIMDK